MIKRESKQSQDNENGNICIECGLCCDGSMFDRAVINKHDDLEFLKQMGVESFTVDDKLFFQLPCKGQEGIRCRLYHDERRFKVCKIFKCKLLRQYHSGEISCYDALNIIRELRMRRQNIEAFSEILHEGQNCPGPSIFSFVRNLYRSGKLDDPAFRRSYPKQVLDCFIFTDLLKQRFYTKNSKVSETLPVNRCRPDQAQGD
jgi:hypothetical protein